jgi:D-glycero-alpha-D-manno-heptose-7-phosphate kinase
LAKDACNIEIDLCNEPIGKQDQYAAAFGGFNFIEFHANESVIVTPIECKPETLQLLQDNLLVFYTGKTRSASALLRNQSLELLQNQVKRDAMHQMVQLAKDLNSELSANNLDSFGEILHTGWMLKKSLVSDISENEIDLWYQAAIAAGAQGGKILGAGAGGFLLFYAPKERHQAIRRALPTLKSIPMAFDNHGSQIIFNEKIAL